VITSSDVIESLSLPSELQLMLAFDHLCCCNPLSHINFIFIHNLAQFLRVITARAVDLHSGRIFDDADMTWALTPAFQWKVISLDYCLSVIP
jgi:hypothetical protein